ncbi:hypothetical protein [Streptomyces sp. NPDC017260]|uniref:hypothetical protein n=1 Tax=unclassified Streptomyces TaxID=2593676 RepID=UPI0037B6AEDD
MHVTLKGGARAQWLNDVRTLRTFRIGSSGMKVQVYSLWSDTDSRMAWIECNSGTWRLPDKLFGWAEVIEQRAVDLGFSDPWPCWAVFEEGADGVIEVEILPEGYRPTGR